MSRYTARPYLARQYIASSPRAEVSGRLMLAFAKNSEAHHIQPFLESRGLADIRADHWYPQQVYMDILKEIDETLETGTARAAFIAFGREVAETEHVPRKTKTISDVLRKLNMLYQDDLRNFPEAEGYLVEWYDSTHCIIYQNTPNPEDAIYGYIWGMVARFKAPEEEFTLRILEYNDRYDISRSAYDIQWGV